MYLSGINACIFFIVIGSDDTFFSSDPDDISTFLSPTVLREGGREVEYTYACGTRWELWAICAGICYEAIQSFIEEDVLCKLCIY